MVLQDIFFHVAGIAFLTSAKTKSIFRGYSSPKPFGMSDIEKCIRYDINVVENWLFHLRKYTNEADFLVGKDVLELGPGSDLGVGLYLLAQGCSQYNACDVNDLMASTPDDFYEQFLAKIKSTNSQAKIDFLRTQLQEVKVGNLSKFNYVLRDDFNIVAAFGKATIDLVFSQAAFEHFDDINTTFSQLSTVCRSGAVLISQVDLQTHSRWIRRQDPNNIYRYPSWFYNMFWFRGSPNRIRPYQYQEILERHGWTDVSIVAVETTKDYNQAYSGMNNAFADNKNQMEYLSIMLCARKV